MKKIILLMAFVFVFAILSVNVKALENYNWQWNFTSESITVDGLAMEAIGGLNPVDCNCPLFDPFCWWRCEVEQQQNYTTSDCFTVNAEFLETYDGQQGIGYYEQTCEIPPLYQSMGIYAKQGSPVPIKKYTSPSDRRTTIFAQIRYQVNNWGGLNSTEGKQPVLAFINANNISETYAYSNLSLSTGSWQVVTLWHTFEPDTEFYSFVRIPEMYNMSNNWTIHFDFFRVSTVDMTTAVASVPSEEAMKASCASKFGSVWVSAPNTWTHKICDSSAYACWGTYPSCSGGSGPLSSEYQILNKSGGGAVMLTIKSFWLGEDQSAICQALWFNESDIAPEGWGTYAVRMQEAMSYENATYMMPYCADDGAPSLKSGVCFCPLQTSDYFFLQQNAFYELNTYFFYYGGFIEFNTNGTQTTFWKDGSVFNPVGTMDFDNNNSLNIGFGGDGVGNGMVDDNQYFRQWYGPYGNVTAGSTNTRVDVDSRTFHAQITGFITDWRAHSIFFTSGESGAFNETCAEQWFCSDGFEYFQTSSCLITFNTSCGIFGCDDADYRCDVDASNWYCDNNYEYFVNSTYQISINNSCGVCGCGDESCNVEFDHWECFDNDTSQHYNEDCEIDQVIACQFGCENGECEGETECTSDYECTGYCDNETSTMYTDAFCDDDNICDWHSSEVCEYGCSVFNSCSPKPFLTEVLVPATGSYLGLDVDSSEFFIAILVSLIVSTLITFVISFRAGVGGAGIIFGISFIAMIIMWSSFGFVDPVLLIVLIILSGVLVAWQIAKAVGG